jgi:8-oxo-dGTP diphosphatase
MTDDAAPAGDRPAKALTQGGRRRVPCVGAVIHDADGRLLLVRRGHEPAAGLWSIPGGRIEPGESEQAAVVREVEEETGLAVRCQALLGRVQRPGQGETIFDISDYRAEVTGGELRPADDATDARWVSAAEAVAMEQAGRLTEGLLAALRSWGAC